MKKLTLLFIIPFAIIMADMNFPTSTQKGDSMSTVSAEAAPVNTSGIIPNSVDQIWADMNEPNTGWVSNMPSGFGQFKGPAQKTLPRVGSIVDHMNMWIEVEAGGSGSGCSVDTNIATNTRVEIGTIRMYTLRNNKWSLFSKTKNTKTNKSGAIHPHRGVAMSRGCALDEYDVNQHFTHHTLMSGEYSQRTNTNGFLEYRPEYYYRWHAWDRGGNVTPLSTLQAIFGTVYMRLVKDDPNGIDDRKQANYVAHIASDARYDGGTKYRGDVGISRYKKITNDWVAVNFYSYQSERPTKAEIEANPPPIVLEL